MHRPSGARDVERSSRLDSARLDPRFDFGSVEAHVSPDLQEGDATLLHQAAHEPLTHTQQVSESVDVEQC